MNLNIFSYNGDSTINDGVNFTATFPPGSKVDLAAQAQYVPRAEYYPYLSGLNLPPHSLTIQLILPGGANINLMREKLKAIFSMLEFVPHALICKDADNSNKQWSVSCYPVRVSQDPQFKSDTVFLVTLALAEPIWRSVTTNTDTWNITATGQTRNITPDGNIAALPVLAIKPTSARTGQFIYSRWNPIYNRTANPLVNYSVDITNGGINTANLVNDTTVSNQINNVAGIGVGDTTIAIDTPVGGGLPTTGMGYLGTEQISWTGNTGTSLTGVTRGIGGTTAATHPDNTVIARSKVLANGDDLRVQVDGVQVNRWLSGINTATTKIWIAQNWSLGQAGILNTALPNNGTAVTVIFKKNAANLAVLKALKGARNNVFLVENEAFTYSPGNVDLVLYQITSCSRAQKFTSFAAHSAGVAITWIEHDIWLLYGNQSATAPDVDDTQKPLLDLTNSTNTSWVQTQFFDTTSARPAAWTGQVIRSSGKESLVFTGNQQALANPSTELGLRLLDYLQANIWKAETATLAWSFYHPAGITTVSMDGDKYLFKLGSWPAVAGLQKSSSGGVSWLTVWTEAAPTVAATWQAFSHSGQSLSGTYNNIRLALVGTIAALASQEADIQGDTVTLTLDNTKTPTVALNAEQNIYYIACTVTNNTTGDAFTVSFPMATNRTVTVDCNAKSVTYDDGSNVIGALVLSKTRNNWLTLKGGVANTLQFDDVGTTAVTITTTWLDRSL